MLHGIIDIGSNTIRMAIYNITGAKIEQLLKKKHTVGLASYVKDGIMQQAGIDRAVEVLTEYKAFLDSFDISNVAAFTTAALRNAANSRAAVAEIEARTGINIRVITGDEEATYDFIGATHNVHAASGLLIDIGGGSTELVKYINRQIVKKTSIPLGSLGLKTRYVQGILPTAEEILAMWGEVKATVAAIPEFSDVTSEEIVGIGGTFKGGTALYNELFNQPRTNAIIDTRRIKTIISTFQGNDLSEEQTIMLMRTVPDRIGTVIPGLIIADTLATRFKSKSITYSDSGVREGYIYAEIVDR